MPGMVLGVAEEADAARAVAAEHLERLVDVLVAVGGRTCAQVLGRQLGAATDDAVTTAGPDARVHRAATVAQTLGTVQTVVRRHGDRRRRRETRRGGSRQRQGRRVVLL